MRIKEGEKAKDFILEDISGNPISLNAYKGKKLMLSFYRYASCFYCNLRVHQLIQHYPEFNEAGLSMLAFFQSPKEDILQNVGKQNPPFPIIPDPERTVYQLYGVESSLAKYFKAIFSLNTIRAIKAGFWPGKTEGKRELVPADFLIEDLIIKKA